MKIRIRKPKKPHIERIKLANEIDGREIWIIEEPHFKIDRQPAMAVRMTNQELEIAKREYPELIYRKPYEGEDITSLLVNRNSDRTVIELHDAMQRARKPNAIPVHEFGSTIEPEEK